MPESNIIKTLARLLYAATQSKKPYTLLLGSGLSMTQPLLQITGSESWESFYKHFKRLSGEERISLLQQHFATLQLYEGYRYLAQLIKEGYFKTILTTNVDTFLEEALQDAFIRLKKVNIFVRGTHSDQDIINILKKPSSALCTICFLHGNINTQNILLTLPEIMHFPHKLEAAVKDYLSQDIILSGMTHRGDFDLVHCISSPGGSIWYLSSEDQDPLLSILPHNRYKGKVVKGNEATFNLFFHTLLDELHRLQREEAQHKNRVKYLPSTTKTNPQNVVPLSPETLPDPHNLQNLPSAVKTIKIFYVYSSKDRAILRRIEAQLAPLRKMDLISDWHGGKPTAGTELPVEVKKRWEEAQIILLLVSADIFDPEPYMLVKQAMERHEAKTALVLPILVRQADWPIAIFAPLQVLPENKKPIMSWKNRDEALFDVARGIREAVETLARNEAY
jgi:hypothetical protein